MTSLSELSKLVLEQGNLLKSAADAEDVDSLLVDEEVDPVGEEPTEEDLPEEQMEEKIAGLLMEADACIELLQKVANEGFPSATVEVSSADPIKTPDNLVTQDHGAEIDSSDPEFGSNTGEHVDSNKKIAHSLIMSKIAQAQSLIHAGAEAEAANLIEEIKYLQKVALEDTDEDESAPVGGSDLFSNRGLVDASRRDARRYDRPSDIAGESFSVDPAVKSNLGTQEGVKESAMRDIVSILKGHSRG